MTDWGTGIHRNSFWVVLSLLQNTKAVAYQCNAAALSFYGGCFINLSAK